MKKRTKAKQLLYKQQLSQNPVVYKIKKPTQFLTCHIIL